MSVKSGCLTRNRLTTVPQNPYASPVHHGVVIMGYIETWEAKPWFCRSSPNSEAICSPSYWNVKHLFFTFNYQYAEKMETFILIQKNQKCEETPERQSFSIFVSVAGMCSLGHWEKRQMYSSYLWMCSHFAFMNCLWRETYTHTRGFWVNYLSDLLMWFV